MKRFFSLILLLCAGCASLPRDTDSWTQKIKSSHVLTVGVEHAPRGEGDHAGITPAERAIIGELARRLGARVQYREGNLLELMHAVEERELPVLAAEVRADSPYVGGVAMSRPYAEIDGAKRCIVIAPGQNKLLLLTDEIIAAGEKRRGAP